MTLNVAITRLLSGYDELGSNALEDHRALLENILSRAFFALSALSQENLVITMRLIMLSSSFDVERKTFADRDLQSAGASLHRMISIRASLAY
ncbi:hypothetical protein [Labrys sp. 22185]|uniref:hypothetical protein n=1 Tax=Labrys sp. 22185 TaxID=3453888 RepID=UPI003F850C1B